VEDGSLPAGTGAACFIVCGLAALWQSESFSCRAGKHRLYGRQGCRRYSIQAGTDTLAIELPDEFRLCHRFLTLVKLGHAFKGLFRSRQWD
jgi:hypothetical protein